MMWCTTSWLTDGSHFDEQTTAGNFSSRRLKATLASAGLSLLAGLAVWAEEETAPALAGLLLAGLAVWVEEGTPSELAGLVVWV